MRGFFLMSTKKKVIFVINMQKFITSNIRHLQIEKIITLLYNRLVGTSFQKKQRINFVFLITQNFAVCNEYLFCEGTVICKIEEAIRPHFWNL